MENSLIVMDTDVIIDFFSDVAPGAEIVSELVSHGKAATTCISIFELYSGVLGKRRLRQIEMLIDHLALLPLDVIGAATAGRIYTQLSSKGQLIGTHDILIGAICLAYDLPLYTRNVDHFSKIKNIRILSARDILKS